MNHELNHCLIHGTAGLIAMARYFEETYSLRLTLMRLNNSMLHLHFHVYDAEYIALLVDECLQMDISVEESCPEVILNIPL